MNGRMLCPHFSAVFKRTLGLPQLFHSESHGCCFFLHISSQLYFMHLKHIFCIRSETHDWLWKGMLCIFIQESYKRKLESSDLSTCIPWRYNRPVALVDTLQPNKLCRGRPVPSHLSPRDSNMSTDGLVAVCKRLPLNHVSFPFPNVSSALNTLLEIMFPK